MYELSIEEIQELSPGIRSAVLWLNAQGFETTDSGDGSNYAEGMECAVPYPMIVIKTSKDQLLSEVVRLTDLLVAEGIVFNKTGDESQTGVSIEACYTPISGAAFIVITEALNTGLLKNLGSK